MLFYSSCILFLMKFWEYELDVSLVSVMSCLLVRKNDHFFCGLLGHKLFLTLFHMSSEDQCPWMELTNFWKELFFLLRWILRKKDFARFKAIWFGVFGCLLSLFQALLRVFLTALLANSIKAYIILVGVLVILEWRCLCM